MMIQYSDFGAGAGSESRVSGAFDALHLASAAAGGAVHLLTTDDRLVAKAGRVRTELRLSVLNPVELVMKETR